VLSVEGKTGAPFLMPEGDLLPTPDARGFALTRAGGPIEVRDLSGAIRVRLARRREGGKRSIRFISERALAFTPDGRRLLTQCGKYQLNPTSIRLWDLTSGAVLAEHPCGAHVRGVAFEPDGASLAYGDELGRLVRLRLWE
jgi:WD40 repeat protein